MRKSKYDYYSDEELQQIIDSSESIREVIMKVGLSPNGQGGYSTFNKKVEERSLDITKLKERTLQKQKKTLRKGLVKIPLKEVLVENSNYSRMHMKERILKEGILQNKCEICGQEPEWNGMPLTLQLDHINGVNNDNRIENLRILCPHCHSQQETTGSKKLKKKYYCEDCGEEIRKCNSKCKICSKKESLQNRKFEVTKEELEKLIQEMPYEKIGEMYGVTGNAIKKRAKKLGIELPKNRRGYWQKKNTGLV